MSDRLRRIARQGATYADPLAAIDWAAADDALPWLPPTLSGLAGMADYGGLAPDQAIRFSRVEFARLCAAGLWLEGLLISRIAHDGFPAARPAEARVMLQEVREESGHGLMFLEMIDRAGLCGVDLLGPTGLLTFVAHRLGPDDAAFWAMVYVGETVTDQFALRALADAGRDAGNAICPVARQVLALHHRDEARHIAAARALLEIRIGRMGRACRAAFDAALRILLNRFLEATLFPTPASLTALGVPDPAGLARAVRQSPARQALARDCAAPALALLRDNARQGI
jgi:hypothetical protein